MEITILVREHPWISVQPSLDKLRCIVELDVRSSGYLKVVESISSLSLVEDDGSEPVHLDGDEVVSDLIGTKETKHLEAVKPAELTPSASVQIDRCPHGKPSERPVVPRVQNDHVTHDLKRPAIASVQNKPDQQGSKPLQLTATAGIQSHQSHVYKLSQTTATSDQSHDSKPSEAIPTANIKSHRSSEATETASVQIDRSHSSKPSEAIANDDIQSHRSHGSKPSKLTATSGIESGRSHGSKSSKLVDEVELTILVKGQPWISKQPSDMTLDELCCILELDARRLKYVKVNETIPYLRLVEDDGSEPEGLFGDNIVSDLIDNMGTKHLVAVVKRKPADLTPATSVQIDRLPHGSQSSKRPAVPSVQNNQDPHGSKLPQPTAAAAASSKSSETAAAASSIRRDRSHDSQLGEPTALWSVQNNDRSGGSKPAEPTGVQSVRCPHCRQTSPW